MSAILESLRTNEQRTADEAEARREGAVTEYRQLLARAHKPKSGDAELIRDVAAVLALNSADVARDLAALGRIRELEAQILDPSGEQAVRDAAAREQTAVADEWRAEFHQLVDAVPADEVFVYLTLVRDRLIPVERTALQLGNPRSDGERSAAYDSRYRWDAIRQRDAERANRAQEAIELRDARLAQDRQDRGELKQLKMANRHLFEA